MNVITLPGYDAAINEICGLDWESLTQDDLRDLAWVYYFFSVQFRESLEIACRLYPDDALLNKLLGEECETDNLSPWPRVANIGERMNHDEFVRRLLQLAPIKDKRRLELCRIGGAYLEKTYRLDPVLRASCIASYENSGLEKVFKAFLRAPNWDNPLLGAFRWFLTEHIKFDSNIEQSHGALSRHLLPDERVLPQWIAFRDLLTGAIPRLVSAKADGLPVSSAERRIAGGSGIMC